MSATLAGDVDYACARVAAREGARADAAAWSRIETARELHVMLDIARASPLHDWTAGIAADQEPHAIEDTLRAHWVAAGDEAVRWMPERWQPALRWTATLADLPFADAIRRHAPLPGSWARDEARRASVDSVLAAASASGGGTMHAWREAFARRLPPAHAREAPRLPEWLRLLASHETAMRAAPPGDAALLVQAFGARLRSLRRRATLEPTAVFVFVTQRALDLARLRGEIMRRRLLPHVTATA